MTNLDLREAFNVVSEVVVNRPEALREFDQIYMKISDMLLHAELVSRWTDGKSMVFLGDGDAIGLTLTYLKDRKVLDQGPAHVHVLDFDERIVNSVLRFAERFGLEGLGSVDISRHSGESRNLALWKADIVHIQRTLDSRFRGNDELGLAKSSYVSNVNTA